jgi:hypothetical protein
MASAAAKSRPARWTRVSEATVRHTIYGDIVRLLAERTVSALACVRCVPRPRLACVAYHGTPLLSLVQAGVAAARSVYSNRDALGFEDPPTLSAFCSVPVYNSTFPVYCSKVRSASGGSCEARQWAAAVACARAASVGQAVRGTMASTAMPSHAPHIAPAFQVYQAARPASRSESRSPDRSRPGSAAPRRPSSAMSVGSRAPAMSPDLWAQPSMVRQMYI